MASIPAYCSHCGAVFDGRGGIHIEGNSQATFLNNRINCPHCGRMAQMVDGTFNVRGHDLEIVSAPPLTHAVFAELRRIAEQAKNGEITPEEAFEKISELDPAFARVLRSLIATGLPVLSFIGLLIALYLQYTDLNSSDKFEAAALQLLQRQVVATEVLSTAIINQDGSGNDGKRTAPVVEETQRKPPSAKKPSKRRSHVNAERRRALEERRIAFPPVPRGRPER